jgi:lysophospholipase L1-like esterase
LLACVAGLTAALYFGVGAWRLQNLVWHQLNARALPAIVSSASTLDAYGDSITQGIGASSPSKSWVSLVAVGLGLAANNQGYSSTELGDNEQTGRIYTKKVMQNTFSALLPGVNNMRRFGANSTALAMYRNNLYSVAAWLAIPDTNKLKALAGTGITYSGAWTSMGTIYPGLGIKYASGANSTATMTLPGSSLIVSMQRWSNSLGGTFSITIDGNVVGNYSAGGQVVGSEGLGWAPFGLLFTGLNGGPHTVVITATNGGLVPFEWAAGFDQALKRSGPWLLLGNTIRLVSGSYALFPPWNKGSNPTVTVYDKVAKKVAADLSKAGLGVIFADIASAYNPDNGVEVSSDNIHPSDIGYKKIADAMIRAVNLNANTPVRGETSGTRPDRRHD